MLTTKSPVEEDRHLLEVAFYEQPFYFSYSSLSRLLMSPNIFYKEYVLQEKEIRLGKHLLNGTLIHFLLLEGNNFADHFIVTPEALPSDNCVLIAKEMYEVYKSRIKENPALNLELVDFSDEIDLMMTNVNYYQNIKDKDKRVAKVVEPKTEAYFEFLKSASTKDIIDSTMLDKATLAVERIKANEAICELLGMNRDADGNTFGVYNELPVQMESDEHPFGFKGIIDNMTIDVSKKQININDFKTSGKGLAEFSDTVEYWKYWLQATVYIKLAKEFFKDVIKDDPSWRIDFRFIVFDNYDQLYAFPVTLDTLQIWELKFRKAIEGAEYHYTSKDFTLPYDFAVGNVKL